MRGFAISLALLSMPLLPASADLITLKTGFVIEGTVVDPETDPVVVQLPKGKIEVYKDMIEAIEIGAFEEGVVAPPAMETQEGETAENAPPAPVINLRPALQTDDDLLRYFNEVNAELDRILTRPEETAPGEEQLEELYVKALGDLGGKAAPLIREQIQSAPPRMGKALLDALELADPAEARVQAGPMATVHEYPRARQRAVEIVAASTDSSSRDILRSALQDPVWYVRDAAYKGLARGDDGDLDPIAAGLQDTDEDVRETVKDILQERTGQPIETMDDFTAWQNARQESANAAP